MSSPGTARLVVSLALGALAAGLAGGVAARQLRPANERSFGLAVDFGVVTADGTPVVDLELSEVQVRIGGRVRPVRSLRRVTAGPAPVAPGAAPALPAPFGTNDSVTAGRAFALVVDQESFVTGREQLLRRAVDGLLANLTPADQTVVVALPFGGVRTEFTSDPARVRQAMTGLSGQGNRNETGSDLACRTRRFLEALEGFLNGQAGRSSPLTVVMFTAGLAAPRRDAPRALAPGMCELLVDDFKRIAVAAGAARGSFFVVPPDDIAMTAERWRETISGSDFRGSDNPLEGIEHIAGTTGGVRVPLDAAGSGALLRVARETSVYYVAEVDPEPSEAYGRSQVVEVKVARAGVAVRARPEITFPRPGRGTGAPRLALSDLLASRAPYTEVPLRVGGFTVGESDGRLHVGIVVEPVDPAAPLSSVGAVLTDRAGRAAASWYASDMLQRPLLGVVKVAPGSYRLRVVAMAPAGRIGAAEDVVDARLTPVGPISLGSLVIGLARAEGRVPLLQFGAEPVAVASFDIYGGTAGMPISAALEVARAVDGPALVTVPVATARADARRVTATGSLPLGALPPGDYLVRAVVRLEDGTTGRVARTLRKVVR